MVQLELGGQLLDPLGERLEGARVNLHRFPLRDPLDGLQGELAVVVLPVEPGQQGADIGEAPGVPGYVVLGASGLISRAAWAATSASRSSPERSRSSPAACSSGSSAACGVTWMRMLRSPSRARLT